MNAVRVYEDFDINVTFSETSEHWAILSECLPIRAALFLIRGMNISEEFCVICLANGLKRANIPLTLRRLKELLRVFAITMQKIILNFKGASIC